jgi:hypothetical protein
MKLRDISQMTVINDAAHSRSLVESIMTPEVILALRNLAKSGGPG